MPMQQRKRKWGRRKGRNCSSQLFSRPTQRLIEEWERYSCSRESGEGEGEEQADDEGVRPGVSQEEPSLEMLDRGLALENEDEGEGVVDLELAASAAGSRWKEFGRIASFLCLEPAWCLLTCFSNSFSLRDLH